MGKISILILFLFNIHAMPELSSPAHTKAVLSGEAQTGHSHNFITSFLDELMEEDEAENGSDKEQKSSSLNIMPSSEDFCHSSNIYIRIPFRFHFISPFANLEEKMHAHPCFNIISPPPETA